MSSDPRTRVLDSKCSAPLSLEAAPVEAADLAIVSFCSVWFNKGVCALGTEGSRQTKAGFQPKWQNLVPLLGLPCELGSLCPVSTAVTLPHPQVLSCV